MAGGKSKSGGGARGGGKPGTKQAKAAAEKSSQVASAQENEGEAKKPTVKQVIGGASWTGKLPVNMLSEHCQKQKWGKPEYTMVRGIHVLSSVWVANIVTEESLGRLCFVCHFKQNRSENEGNHHVASNGTSLYPPISRSPTDSFRSQAFRRNLHSVPCRQ